MVSLPFAQLSDPQSAPNWAVWVPVVCALISITGSAFGSYLSAKFFSAAAQSKTLLNNEKLVRYSQGLKALHAYRVYLDEIFDHENNDFKNSSILTQEEKRTSERKLLELLSEKNFIFSNKSHLVIRDFFYENELDHEPNYRITPEDEKSAYYASKTAVKKAIDGLVKSAREDMGWPTHPQLAED